MGLAYAMSEAQSSRIVRDIETLLLTDPRFHLPGKKSLHGPGARIAIVVVSEHPVERPKKQRRYYSGKKKRHTLKAQLVIRGGVAVCIFGAKGRRHDFRVYKESGGAFGCHITEVKADSGYQGLQKRCASAGLPVKSSRKPPLDRAAKEHNRVLASTRIRIEHYIRRLKVFRIVKHPYRNRRKRYFLRLNLIAAICKLQLPT